MFKKIESVRHKPKELRNRYAFWYAFGITTVIAIFWISTIPARFDTFSQLSEETAPEQGSLTRSFSHLKASISNGVVALKNIKENATTTTQEIQPVDENLDFTNLFKTTSSEVSHELKDSLPPKQVLIGTTSSASVRSSDE